jgi:hypothetical protein
MRSVRTRLALVAWGLLLAGGADAQTQVFFLPAGASRSEQVVDVTQRPSPDPLCVAGLRGLDLVPVALGMPGCPPPRPGLSRLTDRVDAVVLIDDREGVSPELARRIPPHLLHDGRVTAGAVRGTTQDRRHVRRTLIVGAAEFAAVGSEQQWIQRIREQAESFGRGAADAIRDDVRELSIPYRRAQAEFQRAIEEQLCPLMVCRSDGGERMRMLLSRYDDIARTHQIYATVPDGQAVPVQVILRRQHDRGGRIDDIRIQPPDEHLDMDAQPVHGRGPSDADIFRRSAEAGVRVLQGRTNYWATSMRCALRLLLSSPSARDDYYAPEQVNEANRTNRLPQPMHLRELIAALDPQQPDVFTSPQGERREVRQTDEGLRAALERYANDITLGINRTSGYMGSHAGVTAVAVQQINSHISAGQRDRQHIYSCWAGR